MAKFSDEYQDTGGLSFVSREEKEVLITSGAAFPALKVYKGESRFGPRYLIITELDDEERALSFAAGTVESRDRMLDALEEFLEREDAEVPTFKLVRDGQCILIRDAEGE